MGRTLAERWKKRAIFLAGCMFLMFLSVFLAKGVESVCERDSLEKETAVMERSTEKKIAYLTFDDGPSILTEKYLDILKEEQVHATFFLIGEQIEGEMEEIVKRQLKEGHELGLHSYCHEAGKIYQSKEAYEEDLKKTGEKLSSVVSCKPAWYRFPWGSANSYIKGYKKELTGDLQREGLEYVDWNVSGEDSVGCPSACSILENVRKDYKKYSDPVILLHDSATCKATLTALPEIIRELKEDGYTFGTLSQRKEVCHFSW